MHYSGLWCRRRPQQFEPRRNCPRPSISDSPPASARGLVRASAREAAVRPSSSHASSKTPPCPAHSCRCPPLAPMQGPVAAQLCDALLPRSGRKINDDKASVCLRSDRSRYPPLSNFHQLSRHSPGPLLLPVIRLCPAFSFIAMRTNTPCSNNANKLSAADEREAAVALATHRQLVKLSQNRGIFA